MMNDTVKVWDPLVRVFHWTLVVCFAVAWVSADEWQDIHEVAGYAVAALVAFRVVWGLFGPRYARFSQFARRPRVVAGYLSDILKGREVRYLGHNPAGGAMVFALLFGLAGLTLTGWLYTDWLWGEEWVEETHELLSNILLVLVGLHVAGVILASLRHRENLVKSMINGRKRIPDDTDVD
ncbi:MAG TPA: cytochrome B [Marinobacter sp.]|jgi:cytochrome b|nr:cytochrome B [Marinobacter sp.]